VLTLGKLVVYDICRRVLYTPNTSITPILAQGSFKSDYRLMPRCDISDFWQVYCFGDERVNNDSYRVHQACWYQIDGPETAQPRVYDVVGLEHHPIARVCRYVKEHNV
jgi:hypothetical protein